MFLFGLPTLNYKRKKPRMKERKKKEGKNFDREKERKECESDEKSMHCDTMVFPLSGSKVSESNKAQSIPSRFFPKPKFSASSYILAALAITFV